MRKRGLLIFFIIFISLLASVQGAPDTEYVVDSGSGTQLSINPWENNVWYSSISYCQYVFADYGHPLGGDSELGYAYTLDGENWTVVEDWDLTAPTDTLFGYWDVWMNDTHGVVALIVSGGGLIVRMFEVQKTGVLSWMGASQTAEASGVLRSISVCLDSRGRTWVIYADTGNTLTIELNDKLDGSWNNYASWNHELMLAANPSNVEVPYGAIRPLDGGKVAALGVYGDGNPQWDAYLHYYDGDGTAASDWASNEQDIELFSDSATTNNRHRSFDITSRGDITEAVYSFRTGGKSTVYHKSCDYGSGWSNSTVLNNTQADSSLTSPRISINEAGNITVYLQYVHNDNDHWIYYTTRGSNYTWHLERGYILNDAGYDFNWNNFSPVNDYELGLLGISYVNNTDSQTILYLYTGVFRSVPYSRVSNFTIVNIEDCGTYVFEGRKQYTFRGVYESSTGGDSISAGFYFLDMAGNNHSVWYNNETGLIDVSSYEDGISVVLDSVTVSGNFSTIDWLVQFNPTIVDTQDVSLYAKGTTEDSPIGPLSSGWVSSETFSIYNLGALGEYTDLGAGNEGRIVGGGVWELWANTTGDAQVNITYRNLQHTQILFGLGYPTASLPTSKSGDYAAFGYDFCLDGTYYPGIKVQIHLTDGRIASDNASIAYTVDWYYNDVLIQSELMFGLWEGGTGGTTEKEYVRLWVDLWIDQLNASTVVGGRVNSYYFGMQKKAGWWDPFKWFGSWNIMVSNITYSDFFYDLELNGSVHSSTEIGLTRVWARAHRGGGAVFNLTLEDFQILEHEIEEGSMRGINTPILIETKAPNMPQGGFLSALVSAFLGGLKRLQEGFWMGALTAWTYLAGFIDSLAAFFGVQDFTSTIVSWVTNFWTWASTSFTYMISFLTSWFTFMGTFMTKGLNTTSSILTTWGSMITEFIRFLDTGYQSGINVWDDLNMGQWITVAAILYPFYLLHVWDTEGGDAVVRQISFVIDVVAFLFNILATVALIAINLIFSLIDAIPVIE